MYIIEGTRNVPSLKNEKYIWIVKIIVTEEEKNSICEHYIIQTRKERKALTKMYVYT